MDPELAFAIQLSLQEEQTRREASENIQFPSLFEVRHTCDSSKSVFSLHREDICTLCNNPTNLVTENLEHPSPVIASAHRPRSIAIRPTIGTFANYNNKMLLHCGITDTKGVVYNFDETGVHSDQWNNCIAIPLQFPFMTDNEWDTALYRHHRDESARAKNIEKYKQLSNNCYDYIIRFLNSIQFDGKTNHTKDDVISRFILKPMDYFESFISILKDVQRSGHYVGNFAQQPKYTCDGCGKQDLSPGDRFRCWECEGYDLCADCKRKGVSTQSHNSTHQMEEMKAGVAYNCDVCSKQKLQWGDHVRCSDCKDFDLCAACFNAGKEQGEHKKTHRSLKF